MKGKHIFWSLEDNTKIIILKNDENAPNSKRKVKFDLVEDESSCSENLEKLKSPQPSMDSAGEYPQKGDNLQKTADNGWIAAEPAQNSKYPSKSRENAVLNNALENNQNEKLNLPFFQEETIATRIIM